MQQSKTGGDAGWGDLSFFEDAVKPQSQQPQQGKKQTKKSDWDFLI
jgi:hypothetical protein